MKRLLTIIVVLCLATVSMAQDISFTLNSGVADSGVKQRMEKAVSALLSEINRACAQERALRLTNIDMAAAGKTSLQALWRSLHFLCEDNEIIERAITTTEGYVIRNIYIQVNPMVDNYEDERERSLTIRMTRSGQIASVTMAASDMVYDKIVRSGLDVIDLERRQTILGFVENYRSYYNEKDLAALRRVFSDDALIITGTVVQKKQQTGDRVQFTPHIVYTEQNKTQYINKMAGIFNRNKFLDVTFSEIEVTRHPTNPDWYAVTLRQHWKASSGYEDDGWVVLLWEFREGQDPIIHRRTWQESKVGSRLLSPEEVINIMDFTIPQKK